MEQTDYRLSAVVYTDIVGFSRMMEKDETGTLELMRRHNEIVTRLVTDFKGTVVKTVGDAFLIDFPNTVQALRCSVAIQDELRQLNQQELSPGPLKLRIGIHLGDIHFFENDALGEGISIASRLQGLARPGGICISQEVHNLVRSKVDDLSLRFKDRGPENLKNTTRSVHVFDVVLPGESSDDDDGDVIVQDRPDAIGATSGPSQTVGADWSGARSGGVGASSSDLLKRLLEETRRAGRRLTIMEARTRLGIRDSSGESELMRLRDRGFLRRDDSDPGQSGGETPFPGGGGRGTAGAGAGPGGGRGAWERSGVPVPPRPRDRFRDFEHHDEDDEDRRGRDRSRDHSDGEHSADEIDRKLDRLLKRRGADESELIDAYRAEFERRMNMARGAMRGHAGSFLGVNGMLFFIWLVTGAGFPWFLFPLLGWGIGFATHRATHKQLEQELNQVQRMENPSRERIKWHRKLWKSRRAFRSHLVSTGMTSALLATINIVTGAAFPWAVIPIGFMAIGVLSHFPNARAKEAEYQKKLNQLGARLAAEPRLTGQAGPVADGDDLAQEARRIRDTLVKQIEALPNDQGPFDADFREMLDTYVHRIEQLTGARNEISSLMEAIPISDLEQDRRQLEAKKGQAKNDRMVQEYQRSIEQIEKQKQSFSELTAEQEMLNLRARTAVNALKQMQIEFARMRSLQPSKEAQALEDLRSRTQDLTQYLRDLREGYAELEGMSE